jgi:hypothetical protein
MLLQENRGNDENAHRSPEGLRHKISSISFHPVPGIEYIYDDFPHGGFRKPPRQKNI